MPNAFLAWQKSGTRGVPKIPRQGSIVDRADRPLYHKTGQLRLMSQVRPGDAIWVAARYRSLSDAVASFVGKIVVASADQAGGELHFHASEESVWFPWNDASAPLRNIMLKASKGLRAIDCDTDVAFQLQTTREVDANSLELLADFEAQLITRPRAFLSYNWSEYSNLPRVLLPTIFKAGFGMWIDRWSGPRRFKEGRQYQPEELVKTLLRDAIVSADVFIALKGQNYEANPWTRFEVETANELQKPIVIMETAQLSRLPDQSAIDLYVRNVLSADPLPTPWRSTSP